MNTPLSLTVVILTFNEEKHIERCILSLGGIAQRVVLIDSFSTDRTIEIATRLGAEVLQNPWVNYATQFQWGLDHGQIQTEWVMRMDADEYLYPELVQELQQKLPFIPSEITGLYIKMRLIFMDTWIKRGYYPMRLLRFWRNGVGYIQQKWMDEHIRLRHGTTTMLEYDMADHNLNQLHWWTTKHNNYAIREAIDRLNRENNFLSDTHDNEYMVGNKRKWYKSLYMRLPLFIRPFLYFFYRYFFRLGFLEGKTGLVWHILQGFWFQFLVDAKIFQIKHLAQKHNKSIREVLTQDFGVKL
jgi:glycosyltransferase involved in cell wall biosynthesis